MSRCWGEGTKLLVIGFDWFNNDNFDGGRGFNGGRHEVVATRVGVLQLDEVRFVVASEAGGANCDYCGYGQERYFHIGFCQALLGRG